MCHDQKERRSAGQGVLFAGGRDTEIECVCPERWADKMKGAGRVRFWVVGSFEIQVFYGFPDLSTGGYC